MQVNSSQIRKIFFFIKCYSKPLLLYIQLPFRHYLETHGKPYVFQKVAYTAKREPKDFAAYLGNALKKNLAADFDPYQMELFSESHLPKTHPGMSVIYEGHKYILDDSGCIWPESGGCMASGRVRELIGSGVIKIKID